MSAAGIKPMLAAVGQCGKRGAHPPTETVRALPIWRRVKTEWMEATEELRHKEVEAKTGRKMAYQAKRKFGLEEKRREAERRKAEVLKTCATGGMKHTANAMMNRA